MSRVPDPKKVAEAQSELAAGQKALSTSLLKWKPDFVEAEPCFQRAGRAFKAAGMTDAAVAAFRSAADCSYKTGNLKQGAVTLESLGRDLSISKDEKQRVEACRLWSEAAGFLQEAGEAVRASDLKLRAAKLVEAIDGALALRLVDECCAIFDGDADKDVYAVEPLRKVMQMQLALGKHASAMRTMDRLFGVWTRLKQPHNLNKLVLSRVVLLLAAADPVSAQREYEKHFSMDGFVSTDEAAAAEDLISAYTEMDQAGMKKILERSVFGFLENAITKLARALPDAATTGATVGVKKADEAASKAVDHSRALKTTADGDFVFTQLGGSVGGGGGEGDAGEGGAAEDRGAGRRAREAEKAADARASLFARPGGGASAAAAAAAAPAAAPAADDDAFAFDDGGMDKALAELESDAGIAAAGAGGGGGGEDKPADNGEFDLT